MPELTLRQLQEEHRVWQLRNFPNQEAYQAILGAIEELGELAHAHLKGEQQIRIGINSAKTAEKKMDAVADIIIFLAGYCNLSNLDYQHCLEVTWGKVKQRDWVADPEGSTHE